MGYIEVMIGNRMYGQNRCDKARRRDFELQSSELWGNKNDLSAQLQIQLIGFEPNLSHFAFLKSLNEKHVLRTFLGLWRGTQ